MFDTTVQRIKDSVTEKKMTTVRELITWNDNALMYELGCPGPDAF
jgi:hypothetical protein